mgnify:CR=1 FL=1
MDFSGRLLNTYDFYKTTDYSFKINYPKGIYFIKVALEKEHTLKKLYGQFAIFDQLS